MTAPTRGSAGSLAVAAALLIIPALLSWLISSHYAQSLTSPAPDALALMSIAAIYAVIIALWLLGESLIEDLVKAVLITALMLAAWHFLPPEYPRLRGLAPVVAVAAWYTLLARLLFRSGRN